MTFGTTRNIVLLGSVPTGFTAEATSLFSRFSSPPSAARKVLINNLIVAAKAHGWWVLLDTLNLIGADSQGSLLNWKSTSFNSTLVLAPTFTVDRDFTTNGTDNYIESNFNASLGGVLFTQDSACFGFYNRVNAQSATSLAGRFDNIDGVTINPRNTSNQLAVRMNHATASTFANSDSSGFFVADRSASNAYAVYRNGSSIASGASVSAALNNATFRFGATTSISFGIGQFACWLAGGHMDAATHALMSADIITYLTAIGAV